MTDEFAWLDPDCVEAMVNIRSDEDAPDDDPLFLDIMQNGVEQNIRVRPHPRGQETDPDYQVYAGRRRWRIIKRLKQLGYGKGTYYDEDKELRLVPWKLTPNLLPAMIKDADDLEADRVTITENINRKDVRPAEIGRWIKGMVVKHRLEFTKGEDREPKQSEIAEFFHRSQSWVSRVVASTEMETETQVEIPTDKHYRALKSMPEPVRENILAKARSTGYMPSAAELERRMKAGVDPTEILTKFDPLSGKYDDDFIVWQLMEECGFDSRSAKLEIFNWKSDKMRKASSGKHKVDNTYSKLGQQYPLWVQDIMMTYLVEAKSFDTIQRYAISLIRHVWNNIDEETREKILKEWVKNNF